MTAVVDSNVMNEFFTAVDISRAVDLRVVLGPLIPLETRRLRAQGTFWMAMALDQLGGATAGLEDEFLPFALRHSPDDRPEGGWLVLSRFLHERVCPAWTMLNLEVPLGGRKRNDTTLADEAAARGVALITRDQGLVRKARNRGVRALAPEEFAAEVVGREHVRRAFFDRFDRAALPWAIESAEETMRRLDYAIVEHQC